MVVSCVKNCIIIILMKERFLLDSNVPSTKRSSLTSKVNPAQLISITSLYSLYSKNMSRLVNILFSCLLSGSSTYILVPWRKRSCLSLPSLYSQHIGVCLVYNKSSINICSMSECLVTSYSLSIIGTSLFLSLHLYFSSLKSLVRLI